MKKFLIRRTILRVLAKYDNPQKVETIAMHPDFCTVFQHFRATDEDVLFIARELPFLIENGYVAPVPGFPDYYRLTSGLRMELAQYALNPALPDPLRRDPLLYGPDAVL